jgi:outer membrane murein-binding lipoprotein Lpp
MSSSGRGQDPLDSFGSSNTSGNTASLLPAADTDSHHRLTNKRPREYSSSENDTDSEADMETMDFQPTSHVTATQALADETENTEYTAPQLPPPLSAEHAALRADFEIITLAAMERLYSRISTDIEKSAADTTLSFRKTNDQLHSQINTLSARVMQLQQQVQSLQHPVQPSKPVQVAAPAKKILKTKLTKKDTLEDMTRTRTTPAVSTSQLLSTPPEVLPTNNRRWETVPSGGKKTKPLEPKLITTKYPQMEREVMCHFQNSNSEDTTGSHSDKTNSERQATADLALRQVNSVLVNNKDVLAPPFIRARVTMRGSIVFTTNNNQNNVVYEHYTTIIADALAYHGKCEKVEIGKRYSQFLLHGIPTHLTPPEIADSIATNYPQLIQGQTPRWLIPTNRREHKTHSTIVMTLTGNVKKASIGRQNLIVCNRECQLEDYISYGRSTQCHNCQTYGHPAALCRNNSCCAVCAGPHRTKEHPCSLPVCKKGPTCIHPPIRCVNCNSPHKATDPNCPERIKLRTFNNRTPTTNQGDAPMAGVAE